MENEKNLKFSFIIPVFNSENYITKCIESIISQTYENYEVLLINDGSSDNSGLICDEFALSNRRIKVFHQHNSGAMKARVKGIDNSTGDYCIFVDSDDYIKPDLLTTVLDCIEIHKADMVFYKYIKVFPKGKCSEQPSIIKDGLVLEGDKVLSTFLAKAIESSRLNNLVCKVVRQSIAKNVISSIADTIQHGEDLVYSVELLKKVRKLVFMNKPLYYYRVLATSVSNSVDLRYYNDVAIVKKYLLENLRMYSLDSKENLSILYNTYIRSCMQKLGDLVQSYEDNAEIKMCFEQIRTSSFFIEANEKYDKRKLNFSNRLKYHLFSTKHDSTLIKYLKCLKLLRTYFANV